MSDLSFYVASITLACLVGLVVGIGIGRGQVALAVCGPQFDIDGTIYEITLTCLEPVETR